MSQRNSIRILMVDDNPGDIELAKIAFEQGDLDCEIDVAYDGLECIEFLKKEAHFKDAKTPDLILLDINMPRMDGKEVLDIAKNDPEFRRIPIIMLTSSEAQLDIIESYEKHANTYIIKPITMEKFIDVAKRIEDFWGALAKLPRAS